MQINSVSDQPSFNAMIKTKNVRVYDPKNNLQIANIGNFVMNTNKIGKVVDKIEGVDPRFTKGISTFLVTNSKSPLIFGIPSAKSYEYNKNLLNEYSKEEHKFDTYIME